MTLQTLFKSLLWLLVRLPLILLALITLLVMNGCTMLGLNYSSLETSNKTAPTPALDLSTFERGNPAREALKQQFEDALFGPWPANLPVAASAWKMIDANYLGGRGTLEEITLTIGDGAAPRTFHLIIALPNSARAAPVPVTISATFSENCSVFPGAAITAPDGTSCLVQKPQPALNFIATNIFGTYIAYAPIDRYFDAGLGYASFYGGEFVPDDREGGPAAMRLIASAQSAAPTSTLMAWAYGFHAAAGVLGTDARIDPKRVAAMGHSRYGKSALIAGAWSDRIHAVIAHQAGFAGASLSRSQTGERLDRMAKSYPHWMKAGFDASPEAIAALPVDQHQLIALIAPKPVFLGNGRRDVWSDPNSSFRAAKAASAAYAASGAQGLESSDMRAFDPSADLAWWMRVGGHSVVAEDIDAFIAFLSAHFETSADEKVRTGTSAHGR